MKKNSQTTHLWKVIKDDGQIVYQICLRCGKKDVFLRNKDYGKEIDKLWLEGKSAFPA